MAKRESQGLLVAVILLVLFALLMSVFTIYFWNQSGRLYQELETASNGLSESKRLAQSRSIENQTLKGMIGTGADEKIEVIEKQFADDMNLFGETVPEENRNYHELPVYLVNAVRSLGKKISQANESELQLKQSKEKAVAEEKARTAQAEAELGKVNQDLIDVRSKFDKDRQAWIADTRELQNDRNKLAEQLKNTKQELEDSIAEQASEIKSLTLNTRNLSKQLTEFKDQSFEVPDGKVVWVNQKAQVVQLNIGRADGLQRQVSFSVFDVADNNIAKAQKKASIEITRVLDDHRAEARITNDEITNPIVPGDIIYSPIWQPGNSMRFALAGFMDLDGDGNSDRKLIKNLIAMNGGVIDAEVSRNTGRTGELSIRTRYLVLGDKPKITQNAAAGASDTEIIGYSRIIEEANQLGVQQIPIERLLSDLGYKGSAKTVALGKNAREQDFDGTRTRQKLFRPRRPPRRPSPY